MGKLNCFFQFVFCFHKIWCHQRRREWQNAQHQLPFSWSPCTHHAFLYTTHHIIWRWIITYKYFLLNCQLLWGRKLIFLLSISLAWRLVYHIFKIWTLLCLINPWKYCSHNTEFWLVMWIKVKCEMSPESGDCSYNQTNFLKLRPWTKH